MNNIRSKKNRVLVLLTVLVCNVCFSQDCTMIKANYKFYKLNNPFIDTLYNTLEKDTSSKTHVLLFTVYEQVNKIEGVHIIVGCSKTAIEKFNERTVISKEDLNKDESLINKLKTLSVSNGYYMAECKHPTEHHQSYFLVVVNNKNKVWVDVSSSTGILENFFKDEAYSSLGEVYTLVKHYVGK